MSQGLNRIFIRIWALSSKRVPNVLSRYHPKRRMGMHGHPFFKQKSKKLVSPTQIIRYLFAWHRPMFRTESESYHTLKNFNERECQLHFGWECTLSQEAAHSIVYLTEMKIYVGWTVSSESACDLLLVCLSGTLYHSWYMSDAWSQKIVSGGRFWYVAPDPWFWNIAPDVWFQNIVSDASQMPARHQPDATFWNQASGTRQMPARHPPDAMFWNQASDARFQNHASEVIFCDHASDVQYESSYVLTNKVNFILIA